MKKYRFAEVEEQPDGTIVPMEYELTEEEIFIRYWPRFYKELYNSKHDNKPNVIRLRDKPLAVQRQACIDEYIVVHWGWKINE